MPISNSDRGPKRWRDRRTRLVDSVAAAAVAVVVGRQSLTGVPEPLPWMAEAGELFYGGGMAMVTGWILNELLVAQPRRRDQAAVFEAVGPNVQTLGGGGRSIAATLAEHRKVTLADPEAGPSPEEWEQLLSEPLGSKDLLSNVVTTDVTGAVVACPLDAYIMGEFDRMDKFARSIREMATFFDADLHVLVHAEQYSGLRQVMRHLVRHGTNSYLSAMTSAFVEYDEAGRQISAYYEDRIRPLTSQKLPSA